MQVAMVQIFSYNDRIMTDQLFTPRYSHQVLGLIHVKYLGLIHDSADKFIVLLDDH